MNKREAGQRKTGGGSGRLIAELSIIFIGVFGAFIAEDVRQQREDDQRAQQIYQAVRAEIAAYSDRAPLVVAQMGETVEQWEALRAEGDIPPPPFYREPRAETPPTAIWQATLASGGVALLDPGLFNQLAEFYNRVESVSTRYLRYNAITEREVLPRLGGDPGAFYDSNGELNGVYSTHLMLLSEIREELSRLNSEAAIMDAALAEVIEP